MEQDFENLINRVENKERKKLIRLTWLSFITITFLFAIFWVIGMNLKEAEELSIENTSLRDSTENFEIILDSLSKIEEKKENAIRLAENYIGYTQGPKLDSMSIVFSDTLIRYYLLENLPKDAILERVEKHTKKYPNEILQIKDKFRAVLENDSTVLVYGIISYSRDGNSSDVYLGEFKVRKNKIIYIRNYESSHDLFEEYQKSG